MMECRIMKTTGRWMAMLVFAAAATAHGAGFDDTLAKAKDGDVIAQMEVADAYAKGLGVEKNPKEAVDWYRKAAEKGNADAQLALGNLLIGGKGVPKDSVEAAKWFLSAAEQGKPAAQLQVARMHLTGLGVPRSQVDACMWAKLAAEKGDKNAKQFLTFLTPKMTEQQIAEADELAGDYKKSKAGDDAAKGVPLVAPPLEQ
jgi:TPR repeat protein